MIFSKFRSYWNYRKWERHYQIRHHVHMIERLYHDVDGYQISKQARESQPSLALTYGEIDLQSFLALVSMTQPQKNTIFYDLGCGLGKTVLAFARVYQPQAIYGIEYLTELHQIAQTKATQMFNPCHIQFLNKDILNSDWSNATHIYINVATFIPETWSLICQRLITHPPPVIISCVKPLNHPQFKIQTTQVLTSWGIVPAYIHSIKNN